MCTTWNGPNLLMFIYQMKRILDEPSNAPVIRKLLLTTVAMILMPVLIFFGVRHVVGVTLKIADIGGSNLWGGIAAVICVNVILVFYVMMAWNEKLEEAPTETKKTD
jgi:hypothetical protein